MKGVTTSKNKTCLVERAFIGNAETRAAIRKPHWSRPTAGYPLSIPTRLLTKLPIRSPKRAPKERANPNFRAEESEP